MLSIEPAHAAVRLRSDADHEIKLGPPSRLPLLGPRYAPITIDLFLQFGHKLTPGNLALLVRTVRENPDVRLLFHPVLGSDLAERGAEAMFAAWSELQDSPSGPERCFAFAEALANRVEALAGNAEAEVPLVELLRGAELEPRLLLRVLRRRLTRPMLIEIWQTERTEVRSPPEIWVNGRRLRGQLAEPQLREELERQRGRAYQALRSGTPLTQLYEQLVSRERSDSSPLLQGFVRVAPSTLGSSLGLRSPFGAPSSGAFGVSGSSGGLFSPSLRSPSGFSLGRPALGTLPTLPSPSGSSRLDVEGSPRRGPEVSPVTITIIGSLDTYATNLLVRPTYEVWAKRSDTVRLVFQHGPTTDGGRKVAQLLAQLGLVDPDAFWRAFDGIRELMKTRFMLRYNDITDLLRRQHVDVTRLEVAIRDPREGETVRALLARDLEQAQRLGVPSLPALLINGRPTTGSPNAESLSRRIDTELKRGLLTRLASP